MGRCGMAKAVRWGKRSVAPTALDVVRPRRAEKGLANGDAVAYFLNVFDQCWPARLLLAMGFIKIA